MNFNFNKFSQITHGSLHSSIQLGIFAEISPAMMTPSRDVISRAVIFCVFLVVSGLINDVMNKYKGNRTILMSQHFARTSN